MQYAVIEHRAVDPEQVRDLGEIMRKMSEWIASIKDMTKKGIVKCHHVFRNGHGSVTVYEVANAQELDKILATHPLDAQLVQREVIEVISADEALTNLSRYMIQV
jgi:hypothetical protein